MKELMHILGIDKMLKWDYSEDEEENLYSLLIILVGIILMSL
jgi:hypothetical protein